MPASAGNGLTERHGLAARRRDMTAHWGDLSSYTRPVDGGSSCGQNHLFGAQIFTLTPNQYCNFAVSQNWQIWVGNDTLWILFSHSFPLNSLWIFHSHLLKILSFSTTERDRGSDLSIYKVCPNWEHFYVEFSTLYAYFSTMAGETGGGGGLGGTFPSRPHKFHFLGGTRGPIYNKNRPFLLIFDCFSEIAIVV